MFSRKVDPRDPHNAIITDIALAPLDARQRCLDVRVNSCLWPI
jgi:hypothetical protein